FGYSFFFSPEYYASASVKPLRNYSRARDAVVNIRDVRYRKTGLQMLKSVNWNMSEKLKTLIRRHFVTSSMPTSHEE
ncbi:hypothetical protein L9F63_020695, partial [Diploptera punctata]